MNKWPIRTLGEVCMKIGSGATPRGGRDSYKDSGIPLIRSQNVLDFAFSEDGLAYIDENQAKQLDNVNVKPGDVLINITGDSIARVCKAPAEYLPARVNQHVAIVRIKPDKVDQNYLLYCLQYQKAHLLSLGSSGGTRNALTKQMLEDLQISLPQLSTQYTIGYTLSLLDAKIENNKKINHHLEQMIRAVFHHLFVENDEVDGWKVGKLGDVAKNIRRGANVGSIDPGSSYIGLEHMPRGSIALSEWGQANELVSKKFIFKQGEFLFGKLRPYFHKVGIAPVDGVCSTDILVIVPKSAEWYGFILGHISSVELINYTNAASTGTKMPRTNWSDIESYEVAIPPVKFAKEFNEIILPMIQSIRANILESRNLANLRDSLLPKLVSGELSVTDVDAK